MEHLSSDNFLACFDGSKPKLPGVSISSSQQAHWIYKKYLDGVTGFRVPPQPHLNGISSFKTTGLNGLIHFSTAD